MRPVLFHIGSLPIRSYGLLIAVAFLLGIWLGRRRAARRGLDPDLIIDLSVVVILVAIAGARLAYVAVRWDYYFHDPLAILRIWEGGLAQYGGMIAGTLVGLWFFRKRGVDIWEGADILAPSLALGVAIGRIGCFLNGCCFGKACDLPWGVVFSRDSIAGMQFPGVHLHPTELYESLMAFIVFLVLLAVDRRRPFRGLLFWLFVTLLSAYRFLVDPIRHYESESIAVRLGGLALTNNQVVGLALMALSAVFLVRLSRAARPAGPDP